MKTKLFNIWNSYRSSYWFVPTVMALLTILAASVTTAIDANLPHRGAIILGWLYSGGPEGARLILSTIAGSMITIAGVVFSVTIVALSLTSSQFGPRLLGEFMRDTGTQVVLGTFISSFLYCLFVLRVVRDEPNGAFTPHVSVSFALLLALAGTAVLIYFIHHVAAAIQADNIITSVYGDLEETIDRLFPDESKEGEEPYDEELNGALPEDFERNSRDIRSDGSGYLQAVDLAGLMNTAVRFDLIMRLRFRPGDFVSEGVTLVSILPRRKWDDAIPPLATGAFILGRQRTNEQDVEFALRQLAEIALRALSPGINDPFTAITCIDWLCVAVGRIASRWSESCLRRDEEGNLRLVLVPSPFEKVFSTAFDQIRYAAAAHPQVILRLLDAVVTLASLVRTRGQRTVLAHFSNIVARTGEDKMSLSRDRLEIRERHILALKALER